MNTEKIIKNQAKQSLKNNWIPLIASILTVCTFAVLIYSLFSLVLVSFNVINFENGSLNSGKNILFYIANLFLFAMMVFCSPLFNGLFKQANNISQCSECSYFDVFYYFKDFKLYLKTLCTNLFLVFFFAVISSCFNFYIYATTLFKIDMSKGLEFSVNSLIVIVALIFTVVINILAFIIFIYFPLFAYANDSSRSVSYYVFGLLPFSFKHLFSTIKLFISFVGWIVLCFFVVPAFYVAPYILCSCATSTKWLFELEKAGIN